MYAVVLLTTIIGISWLYNNLQSLYFIPTQHQAKSKYDYWLNGHHGRYYPVKNAEKLIFMCHGNAGDVSNRTYLAEEFNRLGVSCYLYDYPGTGRNNGNNTHYEIIRTATDVYKHFSNIYPNIILYGESIGCLIATKLASIHPIQKIILQSGPSSITDMINHILFKPLGFLESEFNSINNIRLFSTDQQAIVMHSKNDEIVPYEQGIRVAKALQQRGNLHRFYRIKGSHNNSVIPWNKINEFIK